MKHTKLTSLGIAMLFALQLSSQTSTEMPTGKKFYIQSAMNYGKNNGGYWDLPGVYQPNRAINKGANIQVWNLDAHHDRQFTLVKSNVNGYYEIQIGYTTNSRIDIQGAKGPSTPNGSNVQVWDRTNLTNQRFLFHHMGNGRFKIYDQNSGKILCLKGKSNANSTNVHLWQDHNGPSVEWYLIDVKTKKPFIPGPIYVTSTPPKISSNNSIHSLEPNEELVYGKVGLNDNGSVRYTFAMTRKPNKNKQVYKREMDMPYGPQPILSGGQMRIENNPKEYDLFDYYVVFNGNKIGPFDRIYHMHQDEGDIDKWITPDGKNISFAGVKGQKYYPVFGNKEFGISFWSVVQAPIYDPTSSRTTYAMQWGPDEFKLIENGSIKLEGWKVFSDVKYAHNNNDLLYVGGKDDRYKRSVYLNHKPIGGPYFLVTQAGFLPGTNKPFYRAFNQVIEDNSSKNEKYLLLGDKELRFSADQQVSNLHINDPWVCFSVTVTNTNYQGTDEYKKRTAEIWEYNYRTGELLKNGDYASVANLLSAGKSAYYMSYDPQGSLLLIARGGKVLDKIAHTDRGSTGNGLFKMSPNGDYYSYYNNDKKQPYNIKKNGEPFTIPGVDKILGVEMLKFCNNTGKANLVVNKDHSVGSEDRTVVNGDFHFDIKGRAFAGWMRFAEKSNDVISIVEFKRENENHFTKQIHRNGQPISNLLFRSITALSISADASRYAALVTEANFEKPSGPYYTENVNMDLKHKLLVDGKIIDGSFGAPVWSKAKNKFLVLKQEGNSIRLIEL